VQLAALQTMALVGTSQPAALKTLCDRRLADQPELALSLAQRWLQGQVADALKPAIRSALARQAADAPRGPAARLLEELKQAAP
jgi:hypothetical protein